MEIDILQNIILKLILFFVDHDEKYLREQLDRFLEVSITLNLKKSVEKFEFYDNFSDDNPYKNIPLPDSPKEHVELSYHRIFILSEIFTRFVNSSPRKSFLLNFLEEASTKLKRHAPYIILKYSFMCRLSKNNNLSSFSNNYLSEAENVLNLDATNFDREDLLDLESQIVKDMKTLTALLEPIAELKEFSNYLEDISRMSVASRRLCLESVYNKIIELGGVIEEMKTRGNKSNICNCLKSILLLISMFLDYLVTFLFE